MGCINKVNISQINIELTNKCDKRCYFCGHHPQKEYGEMDEGLLERLSHEIGGIQVQFHRDGEPLLYHDLSLALSLFSPYNFISVVTNGKKLMRWAGQLSEMANTIVVSAFLNDPEQDEQYQALCRFIAQAVDRVPIIIVKWVGDGMDSPQAKRFKDLGVLMTHRQMHLPEKNSKYRYSDPPIPEMGICQDLLLHPSIDWQGNVYLCQRRDPDGIGIIGNLNEDKDSLENILNGGKREAVINAHKRGARHAVGMCQNCRYWGYPNG